MPPENVFESVGAHGYVLRIKVLADAAMAVGHGLESLETEVNDAFAIQTCNVCNAVKRRAVLANRKVGCERNSLAATFFAARVSITETNRGIVRWIRQTRRTAFEITGSVDTFPCSGQFRHTRRKSSIRSLF